MKTDFMMRVRNVMNKKKIIIVFSILLIIIISICIKSSKKNIDIYEYTKNNRTFLTDTSVNLIENINDEIEIYRSIFEIPGEGKKIYMELSVDSIAVWKDSDLSVAMVKIFLNNPPEDDEYYESGIYYSPTDNYIDYDGNIVGSSDETIEYEQGRIKYKTNKICDNWYYFEQAVW